MDTNRSIYITIVSIFLLAFGGHYSTGPTTVSAANILVYGIVGSYSQRISMWSLVESLSNKGHNLTYISPYEGKDPHPRIKDYAPKLWKEKMGPWEEHMSFFDIRKNKKTVQMWFSLQDVGLLACETLYSDPEFVSWVKSSHFDLVIMDGLMNDCAYSIVHYWKSKLIVYSTTLPMGWYPDAHGLPDESSSVSDLMYNFPPGNKMSFLERFVNAMTPLVWKAVREYWYLPKIEAICRKGLGVEEMPPFTEIERNASLVMITTHYTLDYPRSLPPNVVAVGGVAVGSKDLKTIPKNLEDFISKSKEGFIYIAFGTVTEFPNFDATVRKEFIKAIESFPQFQFIWKSSLDIEESLPSHVLVTKWAPQPSLLAHPNIKAFITHSGMGSTTEAIHFSVPVVSLPVLAEQDMNAAGVAAKGAGIVLEITTLKHSELEIAIKEVVYNPKYRMAMQKLSMIFKDRPMAATNTALWWTEFILRHNDTNEYLRSPSAEQPWWVKRQIDVWLFAVILVIALAIISMYLFFVIGKVILSLIFSNMQPQSTKTIKEKWN